MKRLLGFAIALSLVTPCGKALAQDTAGSVAAFDEAERLMAEGKVAEACPKYAASQRLDPQLGTLLHLADCFERNGQTASAWASFRDAAELAQTKGDARRELAEDRVKALVPRLSKLQINAPAGIHVERDGVAVGNELLGAPVPTDPGPHQIVATAPGFKQWTGEAVVPADATVTTVVVPPLEKEGVAPPVAAAAKTDTGEGTPRKDTGSGAQRWPAYAAAGVGVAGIAVGTIFGLQSMSKGKEAKEHCDGATCDDKKGVTLSDEALAAGNVSTVGFIVGGVGLAAGAVLWFTLPSGSSESARDGVERGRLRVGVTPTSITFGKVW